MTDYATRCGLQNPKRMCEAHAQVWVRVAKVWRKQHRHCMQTVSRASTQHLQGMGQKAPVLMQASMVNRPEACCS